MPVKLGRKHAREIAARPDLCIMAGCVGPALYRNAVTRKRVISGYCAAHKAEAVSAATYKERRWED